MSDAQRGESGLPFKPVYGPPDLDGWDPAAQLGEPGAYALDLMATHLGRHRIESEMPAAAAGQVLSAEEFLAANGELFTGR